MKKATAAEQELLVTYVAELIIHGKRGVAIHAAIEAHLKDTLSPTTAVEYAVRARKKIKAMVDINIENNLAIANERLDLVIEKSFNIQDYKTIIMAQKEKNAINGLHQVTVRHEGAITFDLSGYSDDELREEANGAIRQPTTPC